jgi:ERF superfamily
MKVYSKLSRARVALQGCSLNKSGNNKFAGYKYFELADFLPTVQAIFNDVGLCDVISFTEDVATMTIYDVEDGSSVVFTSPMGSANLKGCHMVQNIGAVETYQRRYLYTVSMAIVEHDALDATTGGIAPEVKPEVKKEVKTFLEADTKEDPEDKKKAQTMLVDMMVSVGKSCVDTAELTSFWKHNQGEIDLLKTNNPDEFKRLQEAFAEYKLNLKKD